MSIPTPRRVDQMLLEYVIKLISLSGLILAISLPTKAPASAADDTAACSASFMGSELVIRTTAIERRWRVLGDHLQAISLRDVKSNREWIAPSSAPQSQVQTQFISSQKWEADFPQEKSLVVDLLKDGARQQGYRFRIFPHSSAISVERVGATRESPIFTVPVDNASGIESEKLTPQNAPGETVDAVENFVLAPAHLRLTEVELLDQTDVHNELVHERNWLLHPNEEIRLQGNLFILEDTLTGGGLILLKEAPLPHARPEKSTSDFEFTGAQNRLRLPDTYVGSNGRGYWFTTLVYSGGQSGITKALQEYQRQLRPYLPGRDGMFLSNTWGDRSRDARINESFMREEISAGARLGVDVIQIDDGWQRGRTKNSAVSAGGVWNGFWAADPAFWDVNHERFPSGLEPLIATARKQRMGFGLWFAPDSSGDFQNWERDAARLLQIHRSLGVNYFKIDGVKATSKLSEERLALLFTRVLSESQGKIVFDLDVTAEIRPGYFGAMSVGPLFIENRYTDKHSYWPHETLRNLWSLAHYVDPLRLRVEFLNQSRNTNLYPDDPLAPSEYSPACLFATTMMANPLGWFETSRLPTRYFDELKPLVQAWKKERVRMQSGQILPIGEAPDGVAWTGFLSVAQDPQGKDRQGKDGQGKDGQGGYLLVFRERSSSAHWDAPLPPSISRFSQIKLLGGEGAASLRNGRLEVSIPKTLGFAWFRIDKQ